MNNITKAFKAKAKRGLCMATGGIAKTYDNTGYSDEGKASMLSSFGNRMLGSDKQPTMLDPAPAATPTTGRPTGIADDWGGGGGAPGMAAQPGRTRNPFQEMDEGIALGNAMGEMSNTERYQMSNPTNAPYKAGGITPGSSAAASMLRQQTDLQSALRDKMAKQPLYQGLELADGGVAPVESAEQVMARMAAKYGGGAALAAAPAPAPAPIQPSIQPSIQPAAQAPRGLVGAYNALRGRGAQIDKAAGYADGGVPVKTADQLMAEMAAKYGGGAAAAVAPAPIQPAIQQAPAPAPAPQPRGIAGAFNALRNRGAQIDKAAGYADGTGGIRDGIVYGKGGPREDKVKANLSPGEGVIPAEMVNNYFGGPEKLEELIESQTGRPTATRGLSPDGRLHANDGFEGGYRRAPLDPELVVPEAVPEAVPEPPPKAAGEGAGMWEDFKGRAKAAYDGARGKAAAEPAAAAEPKAAPAEPAASSAPRRPISAKAAELGRMYGKEGARGIATRTAKGIENNLNTKTGRISTAVGTALQVGDHFDALNADTGYGMGVGDKTGLTPVEKAQILLRDAAVVGGGAIGGAAGAGAGAFGGTLVVPGVGTAVGGLAGGIGGATAGASLADQGMDAARRGINQTYKSFGGRGELIEDTDSIIRRSKEFRKNKGFEEGAIQRTTGEINASIGNGLEALGMIKRPEGKTAAAGGLPLSGAPAPVEVSHAPAPAAGPPMDVATEQSADAALRAAPSGYDGAPAAPEAAPNPERVLGTVTDSRGKTTTVRGLTNPYTGTDGKPTNDWTKTDRYAQAMQVNKEAEHFARTQQRWKLEAMAQSNNPFDRAKAAQISAQRAQEDAAQNAAARIAAEDRRTGLADQIAQQNIGIQQQRADTDARQADNQAAYYSGMGRQQQAAASVAAMEANEKNIEEQLDRDYRTPDGKPDVESRRHYDAIMQKSLGAKGLTRAGQLSPLELQSIKGMAMLLANKDRMSGSWWTGVRARLTGRRPVTNENPDNVRFSKIDPSVFGDTVTDAHGVTYNVKDLLGGNNSADTDAALAALQKP